MAVAILSIRLFKKTPAKMHDENIKSVSLHFNEQ